MIRTLLVIGMIAMFIGILVLIVLGMKQIMTL